VRETILSTPKGHNEPAPLDKTSSGAEIEQT